MQTDLRVYRTINTTCVSKLPCDKFVDNLEGKKIVLVGPTLFYYKCLLRENILSLSIYLDIFNQTQIKTFQR